MDNATKQKLEELFKELFPELAAEIKETIEKNKIEIAMLKAQGTEQKQIIEKIQSETAKKMNLYVPGTNILVPVIHKGRRISDFAPAFSVSEDYKTGFAKMFIDLFEARMKNNFTASISMLTKDMTEGSADAIGYTVFPEYVKTVLAFARQKSVIMQKCTIRTTGVDNVYIPTETTSVNVYWTDEGSTLTQSEPVVGQLHLTPKKLGAFSVISNECYKDMFFDLVTWLTELFAEAIAIELDSQILNGTQFTGLISSITSAVDCGNTVTISKLSDLINNIPSNKATGMEIVMHRNGYKKILELADGASQAVFPPSTGPAKRIWDIPITLSEQFPSTVTDDDIIAVCGNLKNYVVVIRADETELGVDPYGLFTKDQTRFRITQRLHGAPWNVSGFTKLQY